MLYYETGSSDPRFNQALEELLFERAGSEDILMLWRNDPAIVCGCYQNLFAEVDVCEALSRGITLVRRTSGGGTVYHDRGNVNFTLIRTVDPQTMCYADFLSPVIAALAPLGIEASQNRICDLILNGKKISGSAQRVSKNRALHHGTLLFDADLSVLRALTNGRREFYSTKGIASSPYPVTNIRTECGLSYDTTGFFARLKESFFRTLPLTAAPLPEGIEDEARARAEEKYASFEWTYGKCPAYRYSRPLPDGTVLEYEGKHGTITGLAPDSPFAYLEGTALDPPRVRALLEEHGAAEYMKYIF